MSAMTYGGWVNRPPVATGGSFNLVNLVGWATVVGAALTNVGTGGELSLEHLQRTASKIQYAVHGAEVVEVEAVRSPKEDLARIREVLSPAISDLAATFGVTRQSVYNWLNGDPVANENAAKLRDLAQAADVLAQAGVTVNAALLKRKFANGKTLFQVAQSGESARESALLLVQILKREAEQRERMNARFANRPRTSATADFDLPSSSD